MIPRYPEQEQRTPDNRALLPNQNKVQRKEMSRVQPKQTVNDWFHAFARKTSEFVGSPWMFAGAILMIMVWACVGPVFGFSDTWQLVINTATTIVTFLMVFLIQNTQNRDARALHLKLDELLHSVQGARNRLIDLENFSEEELKKLQEEFQELRRPKNCEPKQERK